jgi:hypothetical protein
MHHRKLASRSSDELLPVMECRIAMKRSCVVQATVEHTHDSHHIIADRERNIGTISIGYEAKTWTNIVTARATFR